jgi:hypothetical protein
LARKMSDTSVSETRNGFDADKLIEAVKAIEGQNDGLLKERMAYMSACKPYHQAIRDIIKSAKKADNIPTKELKLVIEKRELDRKKAALTEDLDLEEKANYHQMLEKLGDFASLPLGAAAVAAAPGAPPADGGFGDGKDMRPRAARPESQEHPKERPDAEALAKLGTGEKPPSKADKKRVDADGKPLN